MSVISIYFINSLKLLLLNTKVHNFLYVLKRLRLIRSLTKLLYWFIEQFGIQGPESYLYTSKSNCLDVDGIDDTKDYEETLVVYIMLFFVANCIIYFNNVFS